MDTTILVFGASITWGSWDPDGGWVGRLNKFLIERVANENDPLFPVYNLGVSGNTSAKLLKRFESEATARIERDENRVVVIVAIGTNDAAKVNDREPQTPPEEFKANLKRLVSCARKFASSIALVGLTPVDESRTAPVSWDANLFYRNGPLREYDETIKAVAREESVPFIDIFAPFSAGGYADLLDDGLHPNSTGHQLMFEIIKSELVEQKII